MRGTHEGGGQITRRRLGLRDSVGFDLPPAPGFANKFDVCLCCNRGTFTRRFCERLFFFCLFCYAAAATFSCLRGFNAEEKLRHKEPEGRLYCSGCRGHSGGE